MLYLDILVLSAKFTKGLLNPRFRVVLQIKPGVWVIDVLLAEITKRLIPMFKIGW